MVMLDQAMTVEAPGLERPSVAVTGEVDASNASRLRVAILDAAGNHDAQLEVDLAGITFMDSTGLGNHSHTARRARMTTPPSSARRPRRRETTRAGSCARRSPGCRSRSRSQP
jgi:hypothetical protein